MKTPAGRVLGIDYGSKRVGVAISDPLRVVAGAVGTWPNDPGLLERIADLVRSEEVAVVVVGMPFSADGGKGPKAREVDAFIARLRPLIGIPVEEWDESLSSVEAHRLQRETGMKKKQRQQKQRVDVMAARLILQEFLDQP